jgi:dihydroflavonol-4-reductase
MPVLVTGGSGFIGQHLTAGLLARGRRVRVLDLRAPRLAAGVEHVAGSVLDRSAVHAALNDVDEVYHLAGLPGMWLPDKRDFHAVNCVGTETVLAAARKRGVARFVHCSTESILFHSARHNDAGEDNALPPADTMPGAYTHSKAAAEHCARQAAAEGFPVVIGTPTMPIGPHDHSLTPPTQMLRHFLDCRIQFYLDFVVNLVDVRDVAAGLILAMERGRIGQRYVFGGESIRFRRILQLVAETTGRRHLAIPLPGGFSEIMAGAAEFIADHLTRRPPTGTAEGVRIARRATDLSIEKSRGELGYAPRQIEPTLRETLDRLATGYGEAFDMGPRALRTPAE